MVSEYIRKNLKNLLSSDYIKFMDQIRKMIDWFLFVINNCLFNKEFLVLKKELKKEIFFILMTS